MAGLPLCCRERLLLIASVSSEKDWASSLGCCPNRARASWGPDSYNLIQPYFTIVPSKGPISKGHHMASLNFTMCLLGIYRIQPFKRRRPPSAINFAWEALMSKFYFLLYSHLGILWFTAETPNISRVLLNIIQLSCPILVFPVSSLAWQWLTPFPELSLSYDQTSAAELSENLFLSS